MVEGNIKHRNKDSKDRKGNKVLRIIGNIGFVIFMIIMAAFIFITAQARLTGMEPALLGHRLYIVDSGSMVPTLPVNSMIVVKEINGEQIEKDDIVTYYAGNQNTRVTHRVVEIVEVGKQFITKGDANNAVDAKILQSDRVIGKLAFSIPYIGAIFGVLSSKVGIIILIALGVLSIVLPKLIKRFI